MSFAQLFQFNLRFVNTSLFNVVVPNSLPSVASLFNCNNSFYIPAPAIFLVFVIVFCITKGRWSVYHWNAFHFHPTSVATILPQSLQPGNDIKPSFFKCWFFANDFKILLKTKPWFISKLGNDPGRDSNARQKAAHLKTNPASNF